MTEDNRLPFLRRLPVGIVPHQRMLLDALGYAVDAIEIARDRLRNGALVVASNVSGADQNPLLKRAMFLDAWSIVDHAHNLRLVLKCLATLNPGVTGDLPELLKRYVSDAEVATKMRNGMDHLAQQMGNRSRAKKALPALYGTISFLCIDEFDEKNMSAKSGRIVLLQTGGMHLHQEKYLIANPAGRNVESPVGMFTLDAFGLSTDLSEIARTALLVRDHINAKFEEQFNRQAKARAMEAELLIENILQPVASDVILVLDISFPTEP